MTAKPIHLSTALRSALSELNLTQQQFAKGARISVPLITKILRGDPFHIKSLRLVLQFFRDGHDAPSARRGRLIAANLAAAYVKDIFIELGLDTSEVDGVDLKPELLSNRDRAILSIFGPIRGSLLLSLFCLGRVSADNILLRDSVYALADMSNSLKPCGLPKYHFRQFIEQPVPPTKPDKGKAFPRLIGGSLGEIVMALASEE